MTQPRLTNSTINRMITESRKIQRGIIVWLGIMIVSIFVLVNPANRDTLIIYAGSATAIIISISAIVMSALRIRGLDNHKPSVTFEEVGEVNNDDDASDRLLYSEHRVTTGRLEDHTEPNSIGLGRIDLSKNEWRKLAGVLAAANWRWSRRLLDDTNIWEGLTEMHGNRTKYAIVTDDFVKLKAVKVTRGRDGKITKARVTPAGREAICQLADGPLL